MISDELHLEYMSPGTLYERSVETKAQSQTIKECVLTNRLDWNEVSITPNTSTEQFEIYTDLIEPQFMYPNVGFTMSGGYDVKLIKSIIRYSQSRRNNLLMTKLYSILAICETLNGSIQKARQLISNLMSVVEKVPKCERLAWVYLARFQLYINDHNFPKHISNKYREYSSEMDSALDNAIICFQRDQLASHDAEICIIYWWRYVINNGIDVEIKSSLEKDWVFHLRKLHNYFNINISRECSFSMETMGEFECRRKRLTIFKEIPEFVLDVLKIFRLIDADGLGICIYISLNLFIYLCYQKKIYIVNTIIKVFWWYSKISLTFNKQIFLNLKITRKFTKLT